MSELQAIMARRRKMAESRKEDENKAIAKMEAERRVQRGQQQQHNHNGVTAEASKRGDNLQAIMERRRRLADGEDNASVSTTTTSQSAAAAANASKVPKTSTTMADVSNNSGKESIPEHHQDDSMTSDLENSHSEIFKTAKSHDSSTNLETSKTEMSSDLAGIMERRRRLTDSVSEGLDLSPKASVTRAAAASSANSSTATAVNRSNSATYTATNAHNNTFPKLSSQPASAATTTTVATTSNTAAAADATTARTTWQTASFSLAPAATSTQQKPLPSATASPVKSSLKSFPMSNELQSLIARRKLANGEQLDESEQQAVTAGPTATRRSSFTGLVSLSLAPPITQYPGIMQSQSASPTKMGGSATQRPFSLAPQAPTAINMSHSASPSMRMTQQQAGFKPQSSSNPTVSLPISSSQQPTQQEDHTSQPNSNIQPAIQRRVLQHMLSSSSDDDSDSDNSATAATPQSSTVPTETATRVESLPSTAKREIFVATGAARDDELVEIMSAHSKSSEDETGTAPRPDANINRDDLVTKAPAKQTFLSSSSDDSSSSSSSDSDSSGRRRRMRRTTPTAAPMQAASQTDTMDDITKPTIGEPSSLTLSTDGFGDINSNDEGEKTVDSTDEYKPKPYPSSTLTADLSVQPSSRSLNPYALEVLNEELKAHSKNMRELDVEVEVFKSATKDQRQRSPSPTQPVAQHVEQNPSRRRAENDGNSGPRCRSHSRDVPGPPRSKSRLRRSHSSDTMSGDEGSSRPLRRRVRKVSATTPKSDELDNTSGSLRAIRRRPTRNSAGDDNHSRTENSLDSKSNHTNDTSPKRRTLRRKQDGNKSVDEHVHTSSIAKSSLRSKDSTTASSESASHSSGEVVRRKASTQVSSNKDKEIKLSSNTEPFVHDTSLKATDLFTKHPETSTAVEAPASRVADMFGSSDPPFTHSETNDGFLDTKNQPKDNSKGILNSDFGAVDAFSSNFAVDAFESMPAGSSTTDLSKATAIDAAFASNSAFDSAFDSKFSFGAAAFENNDFFPNENSEFNAAQYTSGSAFNAPAKKTYSEQPLENIPAAGPCAFHIQERLLISEKFVTEPVVLPVNENILVCTITDDRYVIQEMDPKRHNTAISSVSILSSDLQRKVASKFNYTVYKVVAVQTLTAGLHEAHEQVRVRVAAIIDLCILESPQIMQVVAVWQWGYATPRSTTLQFVMTPPKGDDFSYDPASLQIADNMLFVAGSSPKGSCIFMTKPSVRETWSANFVTGSGTISKMSATLSLNRSFPYIAVGLTDGSLCVYSYKDVKKGQAKGEMPKRWLFPLCRLEGEKIISGLDGSKWVKKNEKDIHKSGYCTDMLWWYQYPSSSIQLAVAFQNGLAIYDVSLPVQADPLKGFKSLPDPTQSTIISQTPLLTPFAMTRWLGERTRSTLSLSNLGPYTGSGIIYFGHSYEDSWAAFCVLELPHYRIGLPSKSSVPIRILARTELTESRPLGIIGGRFTSKFYSYSYSEIRSYFLTNELNPPPSIVPSMTCLAISDPVGLTSIGEDLFIEGDVSAACIYHVVMIVHRERKKNEFQRELYDWSRPARSYWLCFTSINDDAAKVEKPEVEKAFGDNDDVFGGTNSEAVCELSNEALFGVLPTKVIRCPNSKLCAILYSPAASISNSGLSELDTADPVKIVFVHIEQRRIIQVVEGRSLCFWPHAENSTARGVILSKDGSTLKYFQWDTSLSSIQYGASYRPILGTDTDTNFIDCRKVLSFGGAETVALVMIGFRSSDKSTCIIAGDMCETATLSNDQWSSLLPNVVEGRSAWFADGESVLSIIGLEGDDKGYRNFAVATTLRVLILSAGIDIVAEAREKACESLLSPIGSFVVCYISSNKVRYLSCLDPPLTEGTLCTLENTKNEQHQTVSLVAIRPDRLLLLDCYTGLRFIELGQSSQSFRLPTAHTKPCLVLDPLLANAICIGGKQSVSTPVLRIVIEKFGRKVASITHGDNEGIGYKGAGLSHRSYEMLCVYGLKDACTWLLTGTVKFDRASHSKVLPPWMPVAPKSLATINTDAILHVVAAGDQYFLDYIKNPEHGLTAPMPRPSEPSSYASVEFARMSLLNGQSQGALKLLDTVGSECSEDIFAQIAFLMMKENATASTDVLKSLSGYSTTPFGASSSLIKPNACLTAIPLLMSESKLEGNPRLKMNVTLDRWTKPMAPSLMKGGQAGRLRQSLVESVVSTSLTNMLDTTDPLWLTSCNEAKHIWNEGPKKVKDNLLLLDCIEDWIGRRRPLLLGAEGASAAKDRGANTLADLLNMDDDSFGGKDDLESEKDGWAEGVGEGRSDESNLSAYFRMSEGDEEDNPWRTEGLSDISHYQNKATVQGDLATLDLKPTTSSVDPGESGKVKSVYDLVFEGSNENSPSCLAISATRGSSVDVGVLHTREHQSRQRCSIEFWYYLPNTISKTILVRRTMGSFGNDFSKTSVITDKENTLFELTLLNDGALEFRSCSGSLLNSKDSLESGFNSSNGAMDGNDDDENASIRAQFARKECWNHVCLVLSSKGLRIGDCSVTLYMKSVQVASKIVSFLPPGTNSPDLEKPTILDNLLQKSYLLLGLNSSAGFRLTEVRIWACERSDSDINALMYEYLNCAESKKKFKVKIKSKTPGATKGGMFSAAKNKGFVASKGLSLSLAPTSNKLSLAPIAKVTEDPESANKHVTTSKSQAEHKSEDDFNANFTPFGEPQNQSGHAPGKLDALLDEDNAANAAPASLWDTALPLSQQVRSSAAGAIIRGPPATRHFGGNRGGLPDFIGMDRFGVGGIAICGSEKTIVWRDNEDPPALTYPIGSSGAIVSDQMDDEGSEFLCCFLAKERRMVVFELQSRTIVVELQMTTKLNFWRFLPPEADENSLCFILITPVGGFHWMPLEESPRPHQVWKRGLELQGKKVVNYEEGGSNGLDGPDLKSRVGLVMVCRSGEQDLVEAWVVPISGDSFALQVSDDVMGACLCQPPFVEDGPFLPLLVTVHSIEEGMFINVLSVTETSPGSLQLGEVCVTQEIDESEFSKTLQSPPSLAMGPKPEAICCSLANIVVVLVRRKGLVIAYELEDDDLSLIASEEVGHYIVDAVMRYSAEVGGAEIVMLLADNDNPKDGRMVSFCFRAAV